MNVLDEHEQALLRLIAEKPRQRLAAHQWPFRLEHSADDLAAMARGEADARVVVGPDPENPVWKRLEIKGLIRDVGRWKWEIVSNG